MPSHYKPDRHSLTPPGLSGLDEGDFEFSGSTAPGANDELGSVWCNMVIKYGQCQFFG